MPLFAKSASDRKALTLLTECSHPSKGTGTVTIDWVTCSTILTWAFSTAVQSKESRCTTCYKVRILYKNCHKKIWKYYCSLSWHYLLTISGLKINGTKQKYQGIVSGLKKNENIYSFNQISTLNCIRKKVESICWSTCGLLISLSVMTKINFLLTIVIHF